MRSIIITGGAATGKSVAASNLTKLLADGVETFSADESVAMAYHDKSVQRELEKSFGPEILEKRGTEERLVRRDWLRTHVLPDPTRRKRLEEMLHPWVLARLERERAKAAERGANLFVAEVPLHYEIGATVSADLVIVVAASRSIQVRRMMENRGLDEHAVHAFLDAQWSIEAKADRADVVIWNDGDIVVLEAQVLLLARLLRQS